MTSINGERETTESNIADVLIVGAGIELLHELGLEHVMDEIGETAARLNQKLIRLYSKSYIMMTDVLSGEDFIIIVELNQPMNFTWMDEQ
ncbi:unnamed protein product [Adineta ricciae]|nr:unnamed protein product [Adineta ricciae]